MSVSKRAQTITTTALDAISYAQDDKKHTRQPTVHKLSQNTSATGLRGDLRSATFGLPFGVRVAIFGEDTESGFDPDVLAVLGVAGDFL